MLNRFKKTLNVPAVLVWRILGDGKRGYIQANKLGKLMASQAVDCNKENSKFADEETCHSFIDTNIISGNTYYYVLEDIDLSGKRTF